MSNQPTVSDLKERIITSIKQFETNAVMLESTGGSVNRTRRSLRNRYSTPDGREAYNQLISENEIHEQGSGRPGDPIIVVLGPKPIDKPIVPQPWSFIEQMSLIDFILRVQSEYESKGWSIETLDIRAELKKALSSYQPERPY